MSKHSISHSGRCLLSRRNFLQDTSNGLGAIAMTYLLNSQGLLSAQSKQVAVRPDIDPQKPLAARTPHFVPKAKKVLVIFCSGGFSHVDSWDYKPELIRRHNQPMPGASELITFQGAQGNLIQSPYTFKPRGESGKYISDLVPNLAELVDDMCFIHSMTALKNTHGPDEYRFRSGWISKYGGLDILRTRYRKRQSTSICLHPRPQRCPTIRPQQLEQRVPTRCLSRCSFQRE